MENVPKTEIVPVLVYCVVVGSRPVPLVKQPIVAVLNQVVLRKPVQPPDRME